MYLTFFRYLFHSWQCKWWIPYFLPLLSSRLWNEMGASGIGGRFHHNAFFASRALHVALMTNTSLVYPLLELIFANQVYEFPLPWFERRTFSVGNGNQIIWKLVPSSGATNLLKLWTKCQCIHSWAYILVVHTKKAWQTNTVDLALCPWG